MAEETLTEEWRVVEGWPDYEVSNTGRVRRTTATSSGRGGRIIPAGYEMTRTRGVSGYNSVYLTGSPNQHARIVVSRLVCRAFNGPPPTPKHEVAHNDGNRTNDVPSNLRWATRKENMADRDKHGTTMRGSGHVKAKLTEDMVREIRARIDDGGVMAHIAKECGVHKNTIISIQNGRSWGWLK